MARAVFLGLSTVDVVYEVEDFPGPNEKVSARGYRVACGGPATNAAITCAFLGVETALVAAVGRHSLSSVIREELTQHNVRLLDLSPESLELPLLASILVSVHTGERTVLSGHRTRVPIPADRFDLAALNGASLLMLDGHQVDCAVSAAACARAKGIPVVLDGGSWKPRTDELLKSTTTAICSADFRPPHTNGIDEVMDYVLEAGSDAVAITRGPDPIVWATRRKRGEIPVPNVKAVDTLAAGDIFHGAFCYSTINSVPFVDALTQAADVAAYSCQFLGTKVWMQSWPRR